MKKLSYSFISILLFSGLRADEGMWMLPLIEKLNIPQMNGMGWHNLLPKKFTVIKT